MYIVIELQKNTDGHVYNIVTEHPTKDEAESKYHTVLSAAAISKMPTHGAILVSEECFTVASKCYKH